MNGGLPAVPRGGDAGRMTQERQEQEAPTVWRRVKDSSGLAEPRVLVRAFVGPGELEGAIRFYERAQGRTADARFAFGALRLATVGAFLVIAGTEEDLRPYRATTGTLLVNDVRPYLERLVAGGAEVVHAL